MPIVFVPRRLRSLTDGQAQVEVAGSTVRQVIDSLEASYPGMKARLYDVTRDALTRGTAVSVDGVNSEQGLLEVVGPDAEVHFLPAIAGG